eukprot:TRINITY_DN8829_c0_g1_i1.p1 TRINITY_DN8829_c0_g1~~TRINITY_DN8829_c0_g1_i1.p1  ORF type:complete len:170 (+),score=46.92 TRINITY_DN8829_c0_g1_i1:489-998(+)
MKRGAKALEFGERALVFFANRGDDPKTLSRLASIYKLLGSILEEQRDPGKAIRFLKSSLVLRSRIGKLHGNSVREIASRIGTVLLKEGKNVEALVYLRFALNLSQGDEEEELNEETVTVLPKIATAYQNLGNKTAAKAAIHKAMDYIRTHFGERDNRYIQLKHRLDELR